MYVLTAFREHDLVAMHRTMQQVRLANLVTATPEPLLLVPNEGPFGTLYGHVARANPQWKLQPTGDAMVLFSGPDAYVHAFLVFLQAGAPEGRADLELCRHSCL